MKVSPRTAASPPGKQPSTGGSPRSTSFLSSWFLEVKSMSDRSVRWLAVVLVLWLSLPQGEARADEVGSLYSAIAGGDLVAEADPAEPAPASSADEPRSRAREGAVAPEDMVGGMMSSARKRNEMVQSTPVAVSAFSTEQLS